ncbi:MAG: BatD family protein [Pseudomonadota bacterium]
MIRPGALLTVLFCAASPLCAQDAPQVTASLSAEETVLGQPLILRIKVLVPSFMPDPPVFPDLEVPGLVLRLPERASSPTSETIGGESWSGVQRSYRLYPLRPGTFTLPRATVSVTFAKGGPSDTETAEVALPDIQFTATVPDAARDISPLILATGFALEETVEVPDDLAVGGAVSRVVTATIDGTTPLLIPPLSGPAPQGVRAYADEPVISEREERGLLSGSRTERVVYLPEVAGTAALHAFGFDWYNLETGAVERAELPAHSFDVAPGPAPPRAPLDPRQIVAIALAAVVVACILVLGWRWGLPALRRAAQARQARWVASIAYARKMVRSAQRQRDLDALYQALAVWQDRGGLISRDMSAALTAIGAARYGSDGSARDRENAAWAAADKAVAALHQGQHDLRAADLPALNP